MNNRNEILHEYHDLIKKLNTSNKFKNQKTELHFFEKKQADGTINLAATVNFEKFLIIGKIQNSIYLKIDPYFEYQKLAQYIEYNLKKPHPLAEINSTIRLIISRLFAVKLSD
jgi:hypothetical protein